MKYLQPSFTIYPAVSQKRRNSQRGEQRPIREHSFTPVMGMCRFCALDEIGHNKMWRKRK